MTASKRFSGECSLSIRLKTIERAPRLRKMGAVVAIQRSRNADVLSPAGVLMKAVRLRPGWTMPKLPRGGSALRIVEGVFAAGAAAALDTTAIVRAPSVA